MIGFFIFDEVPSVDKSLVLAHSILNKGIQGYFYVRDIDGKDISSVKKGSEFFAVMDDSSGFGVCLFIKGLEVEVDNLLLQHNLHVKGNSVTDGDSIVHKNESIDGTLKVKGTIGTQSTFTGQSPNTTINLTAAHAALIFAAGLSGTAAPLSAVPVIMSNGG